MNSKISVIIPVYNTEKHLSQCLDSVINQDYKNLEIIIVNDASTDESLEICKKFAEKDIRIKIIDKKINEGLELARRSGTAVASGKYILHIDSDDWLAHSKVLSMMYDKAEETGVDYVQIQAYRTLDKYGLFKKKIINKGIYGLIEQPELFDKYYLSFFGRSFLSVSIWGKLYRKSLFDKVNIQPLGIKMGEDLGYNIQLFPYLKKIYILTEFGYHYRYGGFTSAFNPYLLPDLKKLHNYKLKLIEKYNYVNGKNSQLNELKIILKSDIRQRIRFKHDRQDIINFLEEELADPVYNSFIELENDSSFWSDPFVKAMKKRDYEKMYEICRTEERGNFWRFQVVKIFSQLLNVI